MDIVEFAEKQYNCNLAEWQKKALLDLYDLYQSDNKLCITMRRKQGVNELYTYLKQNNLPISKELTQHVTTPNCN